MKKIILYILFIGLIFGVVYLVTLKKRGVSLDPVKVVQFPMRDTFANMTYDVGGDVFTLKNGKAEKDISPDGVTKNTLALFGDPAMGDLDKDGDIDAAVWLVNNKGGTGSFYYGVLLINNDGVYKSTNTMFLGDRIAPQTVVVQDGFASYNFAERKAGEPMTTQPSVGRSVWVNLDRNTGEIGEYVRDFEGEASPSVMKLDMKAWSWISATYSDGRNVTPKDSKKFNLTFKKDGTFSASTDCNGIGGNYVVKGDQITFSQMMSTMMFCEGSQENDFRDLLTNTQSYLFTSKGELILNLKFDSGSVVFK